MNAFPLGAPGMQEIIVLVVYLVGYLVFYGIPVWILFRRTGLSPLWVLLLLIPLIGLISALFILAFAKWPSQGQMGRVKSSD